MYHHHQFTVPITLLTSSLSPSLIKIRRYNCIVVIISSDLHYLALYKLYPSPSFSHSYYHSLSWLSFSPTFSHPLYHLTILAIPITLSLSFPLLLHILAILFTLFLYPTYHSLSWLYPNPLSLILPITHYPGDPPSPLSPILTISHSPTLPLWGEGERAVWGS